MDEYELPKHINVMKVVTYYVDEIVRGIAEGMGMSPESIPLEAVVEKIEDLAKWDMSCGYGHEARLKDLIFTDDQGNEW